MKFLALIGLFALAAALGGGVYLYSGAYDIGADRPHWPLTSTLIASVRERSIASRTGAIVVPDLDDDARLAAGAAHYAPMCAGCHLAPGMADTELRQGLYPRPPDLSQPPRAQGDEAARQFRIVKHGVKASGMPAWGKTHDDASIWDLVAFVRRLPQLSAEDYDRLTVGAEHRHEYGQEHSNEHSHGHPPADDADSADDTAGPEPAHSEPGHRH